MKKSSIDVIPRNGQYVVRITENGVTTDHEFNFELHAQAFADGQYFRIKALEALQSKIDCDAKLVSGIVRPASTARDVPVDVYAVGDPEPRPSDDVAAE